MAVNKALSEITKRFNITVREARDIATAVGTLAESKNTGRAKQNIVNLAKQVKEVGSAAAQGKKGTSSNRISSGEINNKGKSIKYGTYVKGSKRK